MLEKGTIVGKCSLLDVLGEGGMAVVYRAVHTTTGRACAVKIIKRSALTALGVERLAAEAKVGAAIGDSPFVVEVLDAGIDPALGVPYLVMPMLVGETIADRVEREGPMPPGLVATVMRQLGRALDQAHRAGVVHRDLKPHNLFLTTDHDGAPLVKVLDFGIAKLVEEHAAVQTATALGTKLYQAPEQFGPLLKRRAEKQGVQIARGVSPETDVWPIGLIAYEMLTGSTPGAVWGEAVAEDLRVIDALPVPSAVAGAGGAARLPAGFDAWFARCLEPDATKRWPGVGAAAAALGELLAGLPAGGISVDPPPRAPVPRPAATELGVHTFGAAPAGPAPAAAGPSTTRPARPGSPPAGPKPAGAGSSAAAGTALSVATIALDAGAVAAASTAASTTPGADAKPPRSLRAAGLGVGAVVVIAAAAGLAWIARDAPPAVTPIPPASAPTASASSAPPPAPPSVAAAASSSVATSVAGAIAARSVPSAVAPAPAGACPAEMVYVPGGTFRMGSAPGQGADDERPEREVTLSPYCIDRTEVTVAAYRTCTREAGKGPRCAPAPADLDQAIRPISMMVFYDAYCNGAARGRDDHPINCVAPPSADAYCRWAGKRLPTEAEWEYAARGSDGRAYPWGNEAPSEKLLNACGRECVAAHVASQPLYDGDDGFPGTAPVGSFPAGASPFGALDMAGNVEEWTADAYARYEGAAALVDPPAVKVTGKQPYRVVRGGGWRAAATPAADTGLASVGPGRVRATARFPGGLGSRLAEAGFRCARAADRAP
jgi:formylglycine-generating enzyme required for sulfatase activity